MDDAYKDQFELADALEYNRSVRQQLLESTPRTQYFMGSGAMLPDPVTALWKILTSMADNRNGTFFIGRGNFHYIEQAIMLLRRTLDTAEAFYDRRAILRHDMTLIKIIDLVATVTAARILQSTGDMFLQISGNFCVLKDINKITSSVYIHYGDDAQISAMQKLFGMDYIERSVFFAFFAQLPDKELYLGDATAYIINNSQHPLAGTAVKAEDFGHELWRRRSKLSDADRITMDESFIRFLFSCSYVLPPTCFMAVFRNIMDSNGEQSISLMMQEPEDMNIFHTVFVNIAGDRASSVRFDYGYVALSIMYGSIKPSVARFISMEQQSIPLSAQSSLITDLVDTMLDMNSDIVFSDGRSTYGQQFMQPLLYYVMASILYTSIVFDKQTQDENIRMLSLQYDTSAFNASTDTRMLKRYLFSVTYGFYTFKKTHGGDGVVPSPGDYYNYVFEEFPEGNDPTSYMQSLTAQTSIQTEPQIMEMARLLERSAENWDVVENSLMEELHRLSNICLYHIAAQGMEEIAAETADEEKALDIAEFACLVENTSSFVTYGDGAEQSVCVNEVPLKPEGIALILDGLRHMFGKHRADILKLVMDALLTNKAYVLYVFFKNTRRVDETVRNAREFILKFPSFEQQITALPRGTASAGDSTEEQHLKGQGDPSAPSPRSSSAPSSAARFTVPQGKRVYVLYSGGQYHFMMLTEEDVEEFNENKEYPHPAEGEDLEYFLDSMQGMTSNEEVTATVLPSEARRAEMRQKTLDSFIKK